MKTKFFACVALFSVLLSCTETDSVEPTPCTENPQTNCASTKEYNPVCGCNNKTYSNPSVAKCAGITIYAMGACKP